MMFRQPTHLVQRNDKPKAKKSRFQRKTNSFVLVCTDLSKPTQQSPEMGEVSYRKPDEIAGVPSSIRDEVTDGFALEMPEL